MLQLEYANPKAEASNPKPRSGRRPSTVTMLAFMEGHGRPNGRGAAGAELRRSLVKWRGRGEVFKGFGARVAKGSGLRFTAGLREGLQGV